MRNTRLLFIRHTPREGKVPADRRTSPPLLLLLKIRGDNDFHAEMASLDAPVLGLPSLDNP